MSSWKVGIAWQTPRSPSQYLPNLMTSWSASHRPPATGHSKVDVALDALIEWLDEEREILDRMQRNEPSSTIDEVAKRLGLDD